jgi:hypothetical protein
MRTCAVWVAALLSWQAVGCSRLDDCKLYNTCAGALIDIAVEDLPSEAADQCRHCLEEHCQDEADSCSVDVECNYTARCRLKSNPDDYQTCLLDLSKYGYTAGDELRKPWEGRQENSFADCAYQDCRPDCDQARFACNATRGEYRGFTLWLAVRKYGAGPPSLSNYRLATDARARACTGGDCTNWWPANANGLIKLQLQGNVAAEELYFEIKPKRGVAPDFPPTRFYPRRFGDADPQLASVYVVRSRDIEIGNGVLGFGAAVLAKEAQSLILPDGCIWEESSLPDMQITVRPVGGEPLPQCTGQRQQCVWYARNSLPDPTQPRTDGTGAGAVGLPEGMYDVSAEDEQGHVVSRRTVRMSKGWMTVVRTWPVGN